MRRAAEGALCLDRDRLALIDGIRTVRRAGWASAGTAVGQNGHAAVLGGPIRGALRRDWSPLGRPCCQWPCRRSPEGF